MTTGRINQVTILTPLQRTEAPIRGETPRREQSSSLEGGGSRAHLDPPGLPELRLHGFPGIIQLPPLSSPKDGPPHGCSGPKPIPVCDMRPSGGGYLPPVTSEDGYRLGLTPKCLKDKGSHRPIIHRLHQSPPARADGSSVAFGRAAPSERAQRRPWAWDHRPG